MEKKSNGNLVIQGISHSVVPVFSPLESLRFSTVEDPDGIKSLIYLSDMYLILNSERIQSVLGEDTTRSLFNQMASNFSKSSFSSEAFSKLSDSDKMEYLKSRFLQTPSEIQSWYTGILSRFKSLTEVLDLERSKEITEEDISSKSSTESSKSE